MSELKKCPFCGGEAKLHKSIFIKCEATVICENCGARTLTHSSASFSDANTNAIKAWDNRKPMDRIAERLEEEKKFYNSASYTDQAIRQGVMIAIEIVKEEGGMNE